MRDAEVAFSLILHSSHCWSLASRSLLREKLAGVRILTIRPIVIREQGNLRILTGRSRTPPTIFAIVDLTRKVHATETSKPINAAPLATRNRETASPRNRRGRSRNGSLKSAISAASFYTIAAFKP